MSTEILDDFDWDNEEPEEHFDQPFEKDLESEVVMLKTFNTEDEAQLSAASLRNAGIDARVIASTTGAMTPFAYGNVRLYIAESQMEDALNVLKQNEAEKQVHTTPRFSTINILIIVITGLLIIGLLLIGLVRFFLEGE